MKNGASISLPIQVYLQPEGDFMATIKVEPFQSYFSWCSFDPNYAKSKVQDWYENTYLPCHHKFEAIVEPEAEVGTPPRYYECSCCTVIVAKSELQLLQLQ